MKANKHLKCSQCDYVIRQGESYCVILGDVFCDEHADEWMKDELIENFSKYRDDIAEILNIHVLEAE